MIVQRTETKTIADLLVELGGIDPCRIPLQPPLGAATEQDVIAADVHEDRLFELVDGVLVEKVMGFYESRLAIILGYFLESFLENHNLGIVAGEQGMLRLRIGLVRIPDLSFISWDRLPNRQIPREPIPALAPDLAVEILSESNTKAEMNRKLGEYFAAGTRLVWYIDPPTRAIRVYTAADQCTELQEGDTLDGGAVLPGFRLAIRELFERAERSAQTP